MSTTVTEFIGFTSNTEDSNSLLADQFGQVTRRFVSVKVSGGHCLALIQPNLGLEQTEEMSEVPSGQIDDQTYSRVILNEVNFIYLCSEINQKLWAIKSKGQINDTRFVDWYKSILNTYNALPPK